MRYTARVRTRLDKTALNKLIRFAPLYCIFTAHVWTAAIKRNYRRVDGDRLQLFQPVLFIVTSSYMSERHKRKAYRRHSVYYVLSRSIS